MDYMDSSDTYSTSSDEYDLYDEYRTSGDGDIQLIIGPMFSGKSTELIRRIRRHTVAKRNCIVIKYNKDSRFDVEKMSTHDRQKWEAISCGDKLEAVYKDVEEYDVIGIDEGQFFSDIHIFCEYMANIGKKVVVAALDGTFQRKPFGSILKLVPLAENVTKLSAVCVLCQRNAAFSMRISDETQVEVIGGSDKYVAVCRGCFNNSMNQRKSLDNSEMDINVSIDKSNKIGVV